MYIKIKHIKHFLLLFSCIFFAGFNYLNFVSAANSKSGNLKNCDKAVDSDCDGLTNTEEKLYRTDPNNSDTDGDGYTDGVEVKSGYDPTKPAPGDRLSNETLSENPLSSSSSQVANESLTSNFTQELQTFIESKGSQTISNADINNFITTNFADKLGSQTTWSSLPIIDESQIKTISQSYTTLSESEKKTKMQQDAGQYMVDIAYLLISNSPTPILNKDDVQTFFEDFLIQLNSLSSMNSDSAYFKDLGNRLALLDAQLKNIEVPETALAMHIKFLRLIDGLLLLREANSSTQDPLSTMVVFSKVTNFADLALDLFQNDFQNYILSLK